MKRATPLLVSLVAGGFGYGCAVPECTNPDYGDAECRVIAENELARLRTPSAVEVRFQEPQADSTSTWDARGLLRFETGAVRARVAGPGQFAISFETEEDAGQLLAIELENVDPYADVWVSQDGVDTPLAAPLDGTLRRATELSLTAGSPVFVRGRRSCPDRYRVAFLGDIQTNPAQFERILEALAREREEAEAVGEPLVALAIAGDLTESSRDDEFNTIEGILRNAPVPVVVTAGNHDIYRPQRPHYNRRFGPGNHVVEICDLRLVMLDSGSGAIARSVEARLPELFERGDATHLIVAMHHPPFAGLTGAGWSREDRAQHLLVEAAIAEVDLIVAGHAHSLRDFPSIDVGGTILRQVIAGTGGAYQGLAEPRFGYLRVTLGEDVPQTCFVEVPPPGLSGPQGKGLSSRLEYCE